MRPASAHFDFKQPPELPDTLAGCHQFISRLWDFAKKQDTCLSELKEKLAKNPTNSSQPPSSEPFYARALRTQKEESSVSVKKKPGALFGHKGHGRQLWPREKIDEFIRCLPESHCASCSGEIEVGQLCQRKQLFDISDKGLKVTEYQVISGVCTVCGKRDRGKLPEGLPRGILGVSTSSKIVVLSGKYKMSKRDIVEFLRDFYNLSVSLGTISNTEHRVSDALQPCVQAVGEAIQQAPEKNADETSHFFQSKLQWLWVVATPLLAYFKIAPHRNQAVAESLMGHEPIGYVITDRYGAYNFVPACQRQYCWAHLIRDFRKVSERENTQESGIGHQLLTQAKWLFRHWKRRLNACYPASLKRVELYREEIRRTLEKGSGLETTKTAKLCKKLLSSWESLWHFLSNPQVEPTNNHAERSLRGYVIWRKTSYGTQSERGSRYVERILTVVGSCRQQKRNVLAFLEESVRAFLSNTQPPSLLPVNNQLNTV